MGKAEEMATDNMGYLLNEAQWVPSWALNEAEMDGIDLTPAHWEVIEFLREYYAEYRMAPPMRLLVKAVSARLGKEKGNSRYLYRLFPEGPAKQACRYAGLPKPVSCI